MITRFASALLRRCLPGLLLLAATATAGANTATEPVPRDAHWLQHHESLAARARQGGVDVLFLGDYGLCPRHDAQAAPRFPRSAGRNDHPPEVAR